MSDRNDYVLALAKPVQDPKEDLLQLSDGELEILESVWKEYGKYGSFQLADLTHEICPEWEDPHGSSLPITSPDSCALSDLALRPPRRSKSGSKKTVS